MTLTTRVAAGTVTIDRRSTDFGPTVLQAQLTLDQPLARTGQTHIHIVYRAAGDSTLGLFRLLRSLGAPLHTPRKATP